MDAEGEGDEAEGDEAEVGDDALGEQSQLERSDHADGDDRAEAGDLAGDDA